MKPDELSHLQPPCRDAALLSNDERIHWLRQERWIQYPRAERILERLLDLVDYPPRDRMPCLVIYGATGMGKTRIIQKFLRENKSFRQACASRLGVINPVRRSRRLRSGSSRASIPSGSATQRPSSSATQLDSRKGWRHRTGRCGSGS